MAVERRCGGSLARMARAQGSRRQRGGGGACVVPISVVIGERRVAARCAVAFKKKRGVVYMKNKIKSRCGGTNLALQLPILTTQHRGTHPTTNYAAFSNRGFSVVWVFLFQPLSQRDITSHRRWVLASLTRTPDLAAWEGRYQSTSARTTGITTPRPSRGR